MNHKGNAYKRTLSDLNQYLHNLNSINLNTTAQDALHGRIVNSVINVDDLLLEIKTKKAMALPGFQDYLKAGINLVAQVPDCSETKECLTNVAEKVKYWRSVNMLRNISYDKSKGFHINTEGETMLNNTIVILNKKQVALYQLVKDLHTSMLNGGMQGYDLKAILSENLVGFTGKHFLEDDLIDVIAKTKF